jgi:putative membrane protein
MLLRWFLAAAHLLALGMGLGAVYARGRLIGAAPLDGPALRRVFNADAWWGVAAVVWISTGLWRLFAGTEQPAAYYLANHTFYAKMTLLGVILVLEVWPMVTLIRWRVALAQGQVPDTGPARKIGFVSYLQAGLVVLMVLAATAMARGLG